MEWKRTIKMCTKQLREPKSEESRMMAPSVERATTNFSFKILIIRIVKYRTPKPINKFNSLLFKV
jgi:hypothetical protein